MKQDHFSPPQGKSTHLDISQETRERVLVRDDFCCRLCSESENLLCYSRLDDVLEAYALDDVITLCKHCYATAQVCKHRRRHTQVFERIAILAGLFLIVSLTTFALTTLSCSLVFALCLASLSVAVLVEAFSHKA
jgi:hypothetical protein